MHDNDNETTDDYECPVGGCGYTTGTKAGRNQHVGQSHSDEEYRSVLIVELQRLADELGETPTTGDMNDHGEFSHQAYCAKFGSWNNAIKVAGFEVNNRISISCEEVLDDIRRVAAELGRTPTINDMRDHGAFDRSVYQHRVGSWNEALEAAGFKANVRLDIPESELLDELNRLADELGRTPTIDDMHDHGEFCAATYEHHFGSWNEALKAAGFEVNGRCGIPEEELLAELHRLAVELEEVPTAPQMAEHGVFSASTYERRFGSWNKALEAAGFEVNVRRGIPEEELLAELHRLADELGGVPTYDDMREHGEFGIKPYRRVFGSWNKALEAAGFEVNVRRDIPEEELLAELHRLAAELGGVPTYDDMDEHGEFDATTYCRHFGSWTNTLEAAGLEVNFRIDIPEEELLAELHRLTAELGEPPTYADMREHGEFAAATYYRHFGSWTNTLEAADYDVSGYVYVATRDHRPRVKIGMTTDVDERMRRLTHSTGTEVECRVAIYVRNARQSELQLHEQYDEYRCYGEWFDLDDEQIEALIEQLRPVPEYRPAEQQSTPTQTND